MPRLSIDITPEQHKRLKASAALCGQSIKDYVLERSLPSQMDQNEREALEQLETLLQPRIEAAERGELSRKTFAQIKQEASADVES